LNLRENAMTWRNATQISEGVYWTGIRDWNRRLFDALIPLPKGTTYNSYLIVGDSKKALIDTVRWGFEKEFEEKIRSIAGSSEIDYVVMNHAEPDHAGSIPYMLETYPKARLLTTSKGVKMAQVFYDTPQERIQVVHDNETISLGNKTLRFVEAPMLHWPETMFTYLEENKILFPCDFFGSHAANGVYDDQLENILVYAKKYWGEIMMPFSAMAKGALEKIKSLEIRMIAPSHGPIYRHPERVLEEYRKWANGETKQKAVVVYVSMWNSTEKMIQPMTETLESEGIEVAVHDLTRAETDEIAKDLVDSRALILGTPTVINGAHPLAVNAAYLVKILRPPTRFAVVLSSYGWSGGAVKHIQETLGPSKMEILGALEINGPPRENAIEQIIELGKTLANKIKASG
jgi:flavorubredoxin